MTRQEPRPRPAAVPGHAPSGLPLLVTVGRTEQTTVLANLHAMRKLTVDGPEHELRWRRRADALEVATSRIAGPCRSRSPASSSMTPCGPAAPRPGRRPRPPASPPVPTSRGHRAIRLSEHLGCDLDRVFSHLATTGDLNAGQHMSELTAALALVRGEALEGLPVYWATDIQQRHVSRLFHLARVTVPAMWPRVMPSKRATDPRDVTHASHLRFTSRKEVK